MDKQLEKVVVMGENEPEYSWRAEKEDLLNRILELEEELSSKENSPNFGDTFGSPRTASDDGEIPSMRASLKDVDPSKIYDMTINDEKDDADEFFPTLNMKGEVQFDSRSSVLDVSTNLAQERHGSPPRSPVHTTELRPEDLDPAPAEAAAQPTMTTEQESEPVEVDDLGDLMDELYIISCFLILVLCFFNKNFRKNVSE